MCLSDTVVVAELSEVAFVNGLRCSQGTMYQRGARIPHGKDVLLGFGPLESTVKHRMSECILLGTAVS